MSNAYYDMGATIAYQGEVSMQDAIEGMIDEKGLSAVLEAIASVCDEKANHIQHNWQDSATARPWGNASTALRRVASKEHI